MNFTQNKTMSILKGFFSRKKKEKAIQNNEKPEDLSELDEIKPYTMEMTPLETWRHNRFWDKHKNCRAKAGKNSFSGIPAGGVEVRATATGLGSIIVCRCTVCNEEEDITDFESW